MLIYTHLGSLGPVSQKILQQIVDVNKCYKIRNTITICRKIFFVKRGPDY